MNKVPSITLIEEPISYYEDSNGIKHENVYRYVWYDELTQTQRHCIGDRDKNIIEDISNSAQEESFFIKYKGQIITASIIITATVVVILVKNPSVIPATAEVVGPAVGRILSVISKPKPTILNKPPAKDIFVKGTKTLPFIIGSKVCRLGANPTLKIHYPTKTVFNVA